jgi:Kef-type K+ transport system membrane component KefB
LAIAANGTPHRLAKQLFAVSEGFFAPVFFVLLGANIDVRATFADPGLIGLAVCLGLGAVLTHLILGFAGVPWTLAALSSAQIGVPAAAVSIGLANGSLSAGQAAAVMCGALITILVAAIAAARITDSSVTRAS